MFTGIIEAIGTIVEVEPSLEDVKLCIYASQLGLGDVTEGDSIAVSGVCLTVTKLSATHFEVHVSKETLAITAGLNDRNKVNLEKALRLNDRLGGHLVSGHIDGIGQIVSVESAGDCRRLTIHAPHAIAKYIARKGSICIDGVSLTINTVDQDLFTTNIIPHTLQNTTLAALKAGNHVNLEIDQIARYVERMSEWADENPVHESR
ncbi:MAG: riboflavin synthase [Methylophilaceae bacterium]